jgi:hypothetical protein
MAVGVALSPVPIVELLFGLLFLLLAAHMWRSRPKAGEAASMPKWMQAIDKFGPGRRSGWASSSPLSTRRTWP